MLRCVESAALTMRHLTLFTHRNLQLWLAARTGIADWCVLPELAAYRPRRGDRLCGCFTVAQWEALTHLGVQCLTPRVAGHAVPDQAAALRCLPRLTLADSVLAPPWRSAAGTAARDDGFRAGRDALLAARHGLRPGLAAHGLRSAGAA